MDIRRRFADFAFVSLSSGACVYSSFGPSRCRYLEECSQFDARQLLFEHETNNADYDYYFYFSQVKTENELISILFFTRVNPRVIYIDRFIEN